jgi:diguanylate cyclase (GGDEF)-like protein/PAS domain S-box-containing protein
MSRSQVIRAGVAGIVTIRVPEYEDTPSLRESQGVDYESSSMPWYSDRGSLVMFALGVYTVGYLVLLVVGTSTSRHYEMARELGFLIPTLAGIFFVVRVARFSRVSLQTRRAWKVIAAAFVFWLLGDASWAYSAITGTLAPLESVGSVSYVLALAVMGAGVLMFPVRRVSVTANRIFWLDSSIILVGLAALIGFGVIGADALRYSEGTFEAIVLFLYANFFIAALVLVTNILVRNSEQHLSGALAAMSLGLAVVVGTNLWWTYASMHGEVVTGGMMYGFWMIGHLLLVLGPQIHYDTIRRELPLPWLNAAVDRMRALLPYSAAAIGMVVLMTTGIAVFIDRLGIVIALVIALIGLIVVRQVTSLRQNERLQAERVIRQTENWYRALVMHSSDLITILDADYRCRYQSPSAAKIITERDGLSAGRSFLNMVHLEDRRDVQDALELVTSSEADTATVEWRLGASEEEPQYFETIISNQLDDSVVAGLVLNSRDVTDRKHLERRLIRMAYHDPLTNLPNRTRFFGELNRAIKDIDNQRSIALLFVDIDKFKEINDTYGHDVGDALLQQFSERLQQSIRLNHSVSRLAGDEFTVLLSDVQDEDEARMIADRLLMRIQDPFFVNGIELRVLPSIGIALTSDPETGPDDLLRVADLAMYAAKGAGSGSAALCQADGTFQIFGSA